MAKNFYSGTDAELASGSTNAVSILTPAPTTYGLTSSIVTGYTALATSYNALYALAIEPATRTSVVISNKNDAKRLLKAASLNLYRIIVSTSSVTNGQLLALRMNERVSPQPRPVPATPPTIDVISVVGRQVKIRLHDASSESRGMPFGATSVNIYSYVGATPPTDPTQYRFEGSSSRALTDILFSDSVASGATVWLSARWVSARSETSVGSAPTSFTLQGGPVSAAA
jgi:hypothetical protein